MADLDDEGRPYYCKMAFPSLSRDVEWAWEDIDVQ